MPRAPLFTRAFLLCAAANFAQSLAFNLFLHFPGFLKDLGAGEVQIGLIAGLTAVASILSRPPVGRSMDLRGRRGVILLGNALNVVVCGLYLTVDAIGPWVYAVRIAHGLAEAMIFTSLFTYAADCVPAARRTEGLALFGASGMLPIALGGVLGDAILARGGYADLFTASLVFASASLLLSWPLRDHPRTASPEEPRRGFVAAALQPDLLPLWWIGTAFAVALAAVFVFLKTYVMETGIGSVGFFFTTYAGAAVCLRVFFGWLPDRVGPKRVLYPALAALVVGFALLATAEDARDVGLAGVLCGLGHGYTFPILFGLVVSRAREAERGAAMSIFTALFDVGILFGGPALGFVIAAAGYPAMFATGACVLAIGAISFAFWDRKR